jgi:hypothetical protein
MTNDRGAVLRRTAGVWNLIVPLALLLAASLRTPALAASDGGTGTAERRIPVARSGGAACAGSSFSEACIQQVAAQAANPEQQLAEKYAPIAYLKEQAEPCDDDGEPYPPAPVEVVLGDPEVVLRQDSGAEDAEDDPIVVTGPTAQDLVGRDETYYLDFPGNPRDPNCDYEQWSKERMGTQAPVTYVHVATEPGRPGKLAVQYWLYFVFNDFNNTHESDWEMIQLTFDADTAEEALTQQPVQLAYAQHGGAEAAAWDDDKVLKEGDHIVVYPAAGSHASQYGSHTYMGWGENGTGFGCDETSGPSVRTPLQPVLLPDDPDPNGPFAWLLFEGRWGEKQPWEFNGPQGPATKTKWTEPVSWTDNIRDSSIKVPDREGFGPSPTSAFCRLSAAGSQVLIYFGVHPNVVKIFLVALLVVIVVLFVIARRYFGPTWSIYRRHARTFGLIGLLAIPIGIAINAFKYLVLQTPPVEWALSWFGDSPVSRLTLALIAGAVQHGLMLAIVGPGIVQAITDAQSGVEPGVRRSYRVVLQELGDLIRALLRATVIVTALNLTVVGIPWAIWNFVRWAFFGQAVIIDRAPSGRAALETSAEAVKGAWWRTLGVGTVFTVVGAAPGPIIGIILLIFASRSVEFVNALSSVVFAFSLPFSLIGVTLLYQKLRDRRPRPAAVPAAASPAD